MVFPEFPPLLAPAGWWRLFIQERLEGVDRSNAILSANYACGLKSREWMRIRTADGVILSLPVVGSASALKNHPPSSWKLAKESVKASTVMASTLATIYGRQPYFHLLKDDIVLLPVLGQTASGVCMKAFENMERILGLDQEGTLLDSLKDAVETCDRRLQKVILENQTAFKSKLSIVDSIVRKGPDAIFALLVPF